MPFPNLFHKRSTRKKQEKDDVTETFKTLILAKIDRMESEITQLRTEWNDVYDKVMHLYDRTRKRIKAAEKAYEQDEPITTVPDAPVSRDDVLRAYLASNGGN